MTAIEDVRRLHVFLDVQPVYEGTLKQLTKFDVVYQTDGGRRGEQTMRNQPGR